MHPEQQNNTQYPQSENTPTPPQPSAPKKRVGLALLLLIGPSVLIVLAIILAAVSNLAFSSTDSPSPDNSAQTIVNVIVFIMGAVTVITWLPGIIIGIILLNKK